jgi:DNA-binding transcriptional LysR family regulator
MIDVVKLATLRTVLARGSFSAAGQELNLTQPAVSRQVSELERSLGVELVWRTQRGVRPTEVGQLLAEHAEAILDRVARAEAEIAQFADLHRGSIRVGAFFTAMVYLSAELAMALAAQHPGLVITDDLVNRDEALTKLSRGALDVAIIFEHDFEPARAPDGIDILHLFDDPVRVLLPAHHHLAAQETIRVRDLGNETWIRSHDGSAARHIDHLLSQQDLHPAIVSAGHGEEPIEAQALVAAGRGITAAYDLNVIINPEQVVARPLTGCRSVRHIQAASVSGTRSPATTATINALRHVGQQRQERHRPAADASAARRRRPDRIPEDERPPTSPSPNS